MPAVRSDSSPGNFLGSGANLPPRAQELRSSQGGSLAPGLVRRPPPEAAEAPDAIWVARDPGPLRMCDACGQLVPSITAPSRGDKLSERIQVWFRVFICRRGHEARVEWAEVD